LTVWQSRGGLCGGVQSGRPRKPLAEVILRSAPLRATSSGQCISIWRAVRKSFKTQAVWTFDSVGIAYRGKELLRPRKQDRREASGGATTAGEVGERHFQRQDRQECSASASLAISLFERRDGCMVLSFLALLWVGDHENDFVLSVSFSRAGGSSSVLQLRHFICSRTGRQRRFSQQLGEPIDLFLLWWLLATQRRKRQVLRRLDQRGRIPVAG